MFSRRSALTHGKNALALAVERRRSAGAELLDLTIGNPTLVDLPGIDERTPGVLDRRARVYRPESFGLWSARAAVADFMRGQGVEIAPQRIVLTASTSEAYAFLFKLLCDFGDRVRVPQPSYPLLQHLATFEGVLPVAYPLAYDGRWYIPARRPGADDPQLRALLAVNPNNPTGSFLKRAEVERLYGLGVPIICDEVFSTHRIQLDDDAVTHILAQNAPPILTCSLHGLSKLLGLPQLKLSWICLGGPDSEVDEALSRLELIADAFLSVTTAVQVALPELLEAQPRFAEHLGDRLTKSRDLVQRRLVGSAGDMLHVEGGAYAIVRLPDVLDDLQWSLRLLERTGVLVQPGYFYDLDQVTAGPHVVISLLSRPSVLGEGLERLVDEVRITAS